MELIYGAFAFVLMSAIIVNVWIRRQGNVLRIESSTFAWFMVGIAYLLIFMSLAYKNSVPSYLIYFFNLVSMVSYVWYFRTLEYKTRVVPIYVPIGIVIFVTAWTVMGIYVKMGEFAILIPVILILAMTSMLISGYYFMRTEQEIQLKAVIAILFAIMSVIKLLYIVKIGSGNNIYFVGLFLLDFIVFINASVLIFLSGYYKNLLSKTYVGRAFSEAAYHLKEPTALFNDVGELVFLNRCMEEDLEKMPQEERNIENVLTYYSKLGRHNALRYVEEVMENGYNCQIQVGEAKDTIISLELSDPLKKNQRSIVFSVRKRVNMDHMD